MKFSADTQKITQYIRELVEIPSPTGFTGSVESYLIKFAEEHGIRHTHTRKGSVIFNFSAGKEARDVMFASHVDTLGAMVREVNKDNIKLTGVGGYPAIYVIGNYCTVHTYDGKTYSGTILPDNPAVHVNKKLYDEKYTLKNLHVRMDIKLKDDDDKLENYINVGNFVSFDPNYAYVDGFVKCRHLDDKASAGILLYMAEELKKMAEDGSLDKNVYLYFNITEETGQGMAGFPDLDELIIVDMGVVGDGVAGDEYNVSICAKDSSGPYNYELNKKLQAIARENELGYKIDVFPFYGSDASAVLHACTDVKAALIGPGVSASHGYERTHIDSIKNTAELIYGYIKS